MERAAPSADPAIGSATGGSRGPRRPSRRPSRRPPSALLAAVGVLAVIGLVTGLALRDAPSVSERAAAEAAERERIAAEQAQAAEEEERAAQAEAERALAGAEALAAEGDLLAARDAFLEVARAGGQLAAVALERAREMGAVYAEEATARLEELLAEERTAEVLAHLEDTLTALADTPGVELFLDGARELVRDAAAQLGPAWRALLDVIDDTATGALATSGR